MNTNMTNKRYAEVGTVEAELLEKHIYPAMLKCALERAIVDAEEVVRCKNCQHSEEMQGVIGTCLYCHHWNHDTDEEGYCHEGV